MSDNNNLDFARGRQVLAYMTNKSGAQVDDGDVVAYDTGNDESFTTTTTQNLTTVGKGVAQERIYNGSNGRILVAGYAPRVNVNGSNVSTGNRNYYLFTSSVAKSARYAAARGAGAFGQLIDSGLTPAAIIQPLDDPSALTNPMTTTGDIIYSSDNSGTPTRLAAGTSGHVLTSNGTGVAPSYQAAAGGSSGSTTVAFMPGAFPASATTGTWAFNSGSDVSNLYGSYYYQNSSSAQNDAISFDFWLATGTYTFFAFVRKSSNTAIITLNYDGASQGTIDTYAAAPAFASGTIATIAVTSGTHTWQLKAATKNASSSSYLMEIWQVGWVRTA